MQQHNGMKSWMALSMVTWACTAQAFTFESDGGAIRGSFDSTISFGVGVRAKSPGCDTIVGTAAAFGAPAQPSGSGAPAGCLDAFYGANDQGNLNYKKGDAFTTYLKGTHELLLRLPDDYKFMTRVNWIKDFAATQTSGYLSGTGATESLTPEAERDLNFKARLLDFWVSKEFDLGDQRARVRVGNQVISWGESLFFPGGINQTNAMDLMRLSQPGTQLKEVMLPAPIASIATGLGGGFNLEAYVQGAWNKNYFPPVGSYWSTAVIGNGAGEYAGGTPFVAMPTASNARNRGQYGAALRYKHDDTQANFGFYYMRYHDKSPVVEESASGPFYKYLEDRELYGVSANFPVGNWAVGTELSYRPKDAVMLNPLTSGCHNNGGRCYAEEGKYQFHLTGILSLTPGDHGQILKLLGGADTATLLVEGVVAHYPKLKKSYNGDPVAAGAWFWGARSANDSFFTSGTNPSVGDKTSTAVNLDFSWTYDGTVIPGWQVTPEIYYYQALSGRAPNAVGLMMEGNRSANFIVTFSQNPANWVIGFNYAKFWGGDSVFDQPLRDRDFYGAYISRNF